MNKLFISLIIILFSINSLQARPISYKGGYTLMQDNFNRVHFHYSPNIKNSIGLFMEKYSDFAIGGFQWNHLLYRKNTKNSQTNLYMKYALGTNKGDFYNSINIAGDSETRKYFGSFDSKLEFLQGKKYLATNSVKFGFAPYIAEYNNLHTWLMLKIKNKKNYINDTNLTEIIPMVRLFKGDYLFELGVSLEGELNFGYIIRF